MADAFISYAREDQARAELLARRLQSAGCSVWWDRSILPGQQFDDVIETALAAARCVVVLWSKHSVRSRWVRTEAREGAQRGLLVPVLLEAVALPLEFRSFQTSDLSNWDGQGPSAEIEQILTAIWNFVRNDDTPRPSEAKPSDESHADSAHPDFGIPSQPPERRIGRKSALVLGGAAVVAGVWMYLSRTTTPDRDQSTSVAHVAGAASAPPRDSAEPAAIAPFAATGAAANAAEAGKPAFKPAELPVSTVPARTWIRAEPSKTFRIEDVEGQYVLSSSTVIPGDGDKWAYEKGHLNVRRLGSGQVLAIQACGWKNRPTAACGDSWVMRWQEPRLTLSNNAAILIRRVEWSYDLQRISFFSTSPNGYKRIDRYSRVGEAPTDTDLARRMRLEHDRSKEELKSGSYERDRYFPVELLVHGGQPR